MKYRNLSSNLCKPSNQFKMTNFIKESWNNARKEFSIPPLSFDPERKRESKKCLKQFYDFNAGLSIWLVNNTIVSYARIFKCKFITYNKIYKLI
jgi:hypothetical protein